MENVNRGAIFKNDSKQKETHPDYRAKINWGGVDIELSMWIKESKEGKKYFFGMKCLKIKGKVYCLLNF